MENNENKSLGGALVDVFDAGVSLVKSEINGLLSRVANVAKAKGLGLVLVLASLVPLSLALIFLILFVFYGLIRLGLGAWAAALLIALFSFAVTGALIFLGIKRLGAEVPDDEGPSGPLSDIAKDDLKYGSKQDSTSTATGTTAATTTAATSTATTGASVYTPASAHASQAHAAAPVYVTPAAGSAAAGHGTAAQGTSTHGKPTSEPELEGVPVSTNPTYREDMKKEGY
ncbi:phage holin family protein [Deinococcus sp. KNUC1210]|uniref:phage holin family protein n=1 Tax=Deinococcus sp. KNUC1210 TaxID=2917691 RepID=UPI001EEF8300|nr:phage holin family protein [Deinococcus sp. KNUC1210]ULH16443.1 phage holin family protein [Deinococcus sp. KNUC1210]